jgi:hypothetical protein
MGIKECLNGATSATPFSDLIKIPKLAICNTAASESYGHFYWPLVQGSWKLVNLQKVCMRVDWEALVGLLAAAATHVWANGSGQTEDYVGASP